LGISRQSLLTEIGTAAVAGVCASVARANDPVRRHGGLRMTPHLAACSFRPYLSIAHRSITMEDWMDLAAAYTLNDMKPTSYLRSPCTHERTRAG